MATITKTVGTQLIALQSIAANTVVISTAQDVSTKLAASIFIHFGRRATPSLTNGMVFRIEASAKSSGDGFWHPIYSYQTAITISETEALTGTVASGQNVLTMASTTNIAAGDIIYIDNTTIANSEFHRVKSIVANTSATIEDNLVNAQTGSTIFDQAEIIPVIGIDLTAISRIRLVCDGSGTAQATAVEAFMVTGDSIG